MAPHSSPSATDVTSIKSSRKRLSAFLNAESPDIRISEGGNGAMSAFPNRSPYIRSSEGGMKQIHLLAGDQPRNISGFWKNYSLQVSVTLFHRMWQILWLCSNSMERSKKGVFLTGFKTAAPARDLKERKIPCKSHHNMGRKSQSSLCGHSTHLQPLVNFTFMSIFFNNFNYFLNKFLFWTLSSFS